MKHITIGILAHVDAGENNIIGMYALLKWADQKARKSGS